MYNVLNSIYKHQTMKADILAKIKTKTLCFKTQTKTETLKIQDQHLKIKYRDQDRRTLSLLLN